MKSNNTEYYEEFWNVKRQLKDKGIFRPFTRMVELGIIREQKPDYNALNGRTRDDLLLSNLKQLLKLYLKSTKQY